MIKYIERVKNRSKSNYKPVVLVTGCGSGIGLALAKLLIRKTQYRVVITTRKKSLSDLKNNQFKGRENHRFMIREMDVTSAISRNNLLREIDEIWGGVDILVNNAAICYRSVVEHMDDLSELRIMKTNYFGPIALIRSVLPGMRKKGRGKVICVSSVSGMMAMPTMSSYSASKHALEGACESLWYEVKPLGVNVTLVQPGFVRSDSYKKVLYTNQATDSIEMNSEHADYYRLMEPFVERMMENAFSDAEKVARTIFKTIRKERPKLRVMATYDAHIFYHLKKWVPQKIFHWAMFAALPSSKKWASEYTNRRSRKPKKKAS